MVDVTTGDVVIENMEVNEESENVEEWRKKVEAMEAEVKALELRVRERGDKLCIVRRDELDDIINQCLSSDTSSGQMKHSVEKLRIDIENLDHELELNKSLTKTELKQSRAVVVEEDASSVCHEHKLQGVSGQLPFTIQYTVQESKGVENGSAKVTKLKVNVDSEIIRGLEHVVTRLEETTDVQGFFVFFTSLSKQTEMRHNKFTEFRQEFKDCLKISTQGDKPHLVIRNENIDRESWRIFWDLTVTSLYRVIPKIYLQVQLPTSAGPNGDDIEEIAASLPETFQTMLKEQGIETAVQKIIKLASGS